MMNFFQPEISRLECEPLFKYNNQNEELSQSSFSAIKSNFSNELANSQYSTNTNQDDGYFFQENQSFQNIQSDQDDSDQIADMFSTTQNENEQSPDKNTNNQTYNYLAKDQQFQEQQKDFSEQSNNLQEDISNKFQQYINKQTQNSEKQKKKKGRPRKLQNQIQKEDQQQISKSLILSTSQSENSSETQIQKSRKSREDAKIGRQKNRKLIQSYGLCELWKIIQKQTKEQLLQNSKNFIENFKFYFNNIEFNLDDIIEEEGKKLIMKNFNELITKIDNNQLDSEKKQNKIYPQHAQPVALLPKKTLEDCQSQFKKMEEYKIFENIYDKEEIMSKKMGDLRSIINEQKLNYQFSQQYNQQTNNKKRSYTNISIDDKYQKNKQLKKVFI
ncbi:hypothetical protein PPERSA_03412 [Pseudocohnilembus persalinus]|uniref:Uncharacterized protein n=1 Tax=Pseudocohnilembus persalinus TaxID=266149 RepID=A0A0V0QBU9_PSEPJ|nr:hypothetical protein PPERSA_03412 [Pseudocohnilembus persalinus]|eukprot:KRW99611.1 hypothetical protein PPERSA_03412 [Pseudocohnilembus persalinus]